MNNNHSSNAQRRHAVAHRPHRVAGLALVVALGMSTAACGSDDGAAADPPPTTTTPSTDAPATDEPTADLAVVTVRLQDFGFVGLPTTVPVGTRLEVVNEADYELHELVAIRLPDDETRGVHDLVHDMEALGALMAGGPPATVLLAPPGGGQIAAVGDGTLTEAGRYLILCAIPTGVAPDVYLQAAAESAGGPPQVEGGPPHLAHGMFAELVVE